MSALEKEVRDVDQKLRDLYSARNLDLEEIMNYYTDDCKFLAPGSEMVIGKDAAKEMFEKFAEFFKMIGKVDHELIEFFGAGDLATLVMKTIVYGKDGSVMDSNTSVKILKKVGGSWKIHIAFVNSDKKPTTA